MPIKRLSRRLSQNKKPSGATNAAPVNDAPAKRGRPAKKSVQETPVETPKKRGRPAKSAPENVATPKAPAAEAAPSKKRAGRPPKAPALKAPVAPVDAPVPTKRRGRPSKAEAQAQSPQATHVSRHSPRAAKTSTTPQLDRVAGPSRVAKRAPRASSGAKAATPPRINARIRSKLRTRVAPAQEAPTAPVAPTTSKRGRPRAVPQPEEQAKPAVQQARRGRPPKNAVKAATPKKTTHKVTKPITPPNARSKALAKTTKAATPNKVTKPVAPRKRRGFTRLDVPDRIVAMVEQYIHDLLATNEPKTASAEEAVEELIETEIVDEEPAETELVDEELAEVEHVEEEASITSSSASDLGNKDGYIVDVSDKEDEQMADASDKEDEQVANAINEEDQTQQRFVDEVIQEATRGSTFEVEEIVERIRESEEAVQHLLESEPAGEINVRLHVHEVIEVERPRTRDSPSSPDFEQFLHHDGAFDESQLDPQLFLHEEEHVVHESSQPPVAAMH